MFFFRHIFGRSGFHFETRFSLSGWRHWVIAIVTVGWWAAVTWLSWQALFVTNLAIAGLGQLWQRADLTPAEERHGPVVALGVIVIIALFVTMIAVLDSALRLCLELCLWMASSTWKLAPFRRLAARVLEGFERKVLRRTPEWEVDLIHPGPRRGEAHGAAIDPSVLAQQIGRERAEVLREL